MTKVQLPRVEDETRAKLNIIKARRKDKTLDEALNYLASLEEKNVHLEQKIAVFEKENSMLQEIRELIFGPIKNHMMESTNEEIDQLEITEEFHKEFDDRLKRFWKRFSKTTLGNQKELK